MNRYRKNNVIDHRLVAFSLILSMILIVTGVASVFAGGSSESERIAMYEAPPREQANGEVVPLPTGMAAMEALQNQFRYVAQEVLPVVVQVNVVDVIQQQIPRSVSPFDFFFGPRTGQEEGSQSREFRQQGLGSGVIVGRSESIIYVLTNNHVVSKAEEISVRLHDEREYEATIVGTDARKDLALISFETTEKVPIAILGDSNDLMVGDWVFAVGNPLGFESTVTSGIVSAVGRRQQNMTNFTDYIQTDAAINQGNSGGALVNLYGEVVGINSWIASNSGGSIGLGFAIPINIAKEAIDDFITSGAIEYGWLGITVGTLNDDTKSEMGYDGLDGGFVFNIVKGSPAEQAGIRPGDLITRIGNEKVDDSEALTVVVGNLAPGTAHEFEVHRFGEKLTVNVTIGVRDEEKLAAGTDTIWPGVTVVTLTDAMRQRVGVPADAGNVVIGSVDADSPADIAGIRSGDIVKELDGKELGDIGDFYEILNSGSGRRVEFTIFRRGSEITIGMARD